MTAEDILGSLVAHASVVGEPNGALVDFVHDHLVALGARCWVVGGPEGDRFNLFATIGPEDVPGYVLSGHLDVVPAGGSGWLGDPFQLRADGDRLIGRGATDMKGFVAAALTAAEDLAQMPLARPVHLALSYDEEAGCRGVRHLLARLPTLCAPPLGCIVGEPSGLRPILAHKGKASVRLESRGVSGHSSRPDLGENAIHALLPALEAARRATETLRKNGRDPIFEPPHSTMQIGRIGGGEALNVIPDSAWAEIEVRAIPQERPTDLLASVIEAARACAVEVEMMSTYPGMSLPADHPLTGLAERLSGHAALPAVSYGTEAGLYQEAGIPAIVCGPGEIARAHRAEEHITRGELASAVRMIRALGRDLCQRRAREGVTDDAT